MSADVISRPVEVPITQPKLGLIATTDQVWSQEKIFELEKQIQHAIDNSLAPAMPNAVTHEFCNGMYARTLFIPAGGLLTGAIHKDESFFLIRSGVIIITTDQGTAEVGPGFLAVTKPGTKRAGLALTDCTVTTFHANPENETNSDRIWEMYTIEPENLKLEAK
jgi:mannose-6-phosphate isomerase-like protein (cupin superfamily)